MEKCPYCGTLIKIEDFDSEFTSFEDCDEYILASGKFICQCGETLTIRASFIWDGDFAIA